MFALIAAALIGCGSKSKKPTTKPTDTTAQKTPAKKADDSLMKQITTDERVSPNIALAGDIVKLCGIKASATANPSFDYDKAELTPEDRAVLDQLATCLVSGALKGRSLSLVGRADPRGTEEYNLGLGSRRASSVSSYLVKLGVDQPRMDVNTRGALDATGTDEAGWQKDRRVDITLANPAAATPTP
jgi:peptidoglycan-associated lipoprotein